MKIEFDKKTGEASLKFAINPGTTTLSSTGKTFIAGQDSAKIEIDGRTVRVGVIATIPNEDAPKAKGKKKVK